jgi:hypothetical protein
MTNTAMNAPAERVESLWWLGAAPLIWALHFLLSYGTAAIVCAKLAGQDGAFGAARLAIALYTAVALASLGSLAWRGWKRQRSYAREQDAHENDTALDRHRFIGFAALLLSGLSGLAVVYAALAALLIESCR